MLDLSQVERVTHIGAAHQDPVLLVLTKGGLALVVQNTPNHPQVLGAGSHPAIAKHFARKKHPHVQYDDLRKNDFDPDTLRSYQDHRQLNDRVLAAFEQVSGQ